jgi:hypothetical protein
MLAAAGELRALVSSNDWLARRLTEGKIRPPLLRLGDALHNRVPLREQSTHVAREERRFGDPAEQTERRLEVEDVAHDRPAGAVRHEPVIVVDSPERPRHHRVAEVARPLERSDPARQPLPNAEVRRLPGDTLSKANQARRDARDRSLSTRTKRVLVEVDAARQVEAALDRRSDVRNQFDNGHARHTTMDDYA